MKKRKYAIIFIAIALVILSVAYLVIEKSSWNAFFIGVMKERDLTSLYDHAPKATELGDYFSENQMQFVGDEADKMTYMNIGTAYPADIDGDGKEELWLLDTNGAEGSSTTVLLKETNGQYVFYGSTDGYIIPVLYGGKYHFVGFERDYHTKFLNKFYEYKLEGSSLVKNKAYSLTYTYHASKLPRGISKYVGSSFFNKLSSYEYVESDAVSIKSQNAYPAYKVTLDDTNNQRTFLFDLELNITSVGYTPNFWTLTATDDFTLTFPGVDQLTTKTDAKESTLFGVQFFKDKSGQSFLLSASYPFYMKRDYQTGNLDVALYRFDKDSVMKVENRLLKPSVKISKAKIEQSGSGDVEPANDITSQDSTDGQ